jgi:hypothetical protein
MPTVLPLRSATDWIGESASVESTALASCRLTAIPRRSAPRALAATTAAVAEIPYFALPATICWTTIGLPSTDWNLTSTPSCSKNWSVALSPRRS